MKPSRFAVIGGTALLIACSSDADGPAGPRRSDGPPAELAARYDWVLDGWRGTRPVGHPSVRLSWDVPSNWSGLPFQVLARQSGGSEYRTIATVTSCSGAADEGLYDCTYVDRGIVPGRRYEYQVRVADEAADRVGPAATISMDTPEDIPPAVPSAPTVIGLDGATYLQWEDERPADDFWKYLVLWTSVDGEPLDVKYQVGETDGTGFLDERAQNGYAYGYRVAAVDTFGHVSELGPVGTGIPRPDDHGEPIYTHVDSAAASGFRFVEGDGLSPVVAGDSPDAQWRLEMLNGVPSLVPRGETTVTSGVYTTALTCGPGSDPGCVSIDSADDPDAPDDYSAAPVAFAPEMTYLVQVRAPGGALHYGKVRPTVIGTDQAGRDLVIFDWAYQTVPNEPSLVRGTD